MLYETATRADEILGIDTEDLDIPNKRARVGSKGGDTDYVFFQAGTARLLPRLLIGRKRGLEVTAVTAGQMTVRAAVEHAADLIT
jgi:integrase/recombinase XerC/integrase/recombinase XerD